MTDLASKFVSKEVAELEREKRQQEWERVRKPEDPIEAPPSDCRSLYDKLQEQQSKKQAEHDEMVRERSRVRGLEQEEAEFLDFVSHKQMEVSKARKAEDNEVIDELRKSNVKIVDKPEITSIKKKSFSNQSNCALKSQANLIIGAVKRKSDDTVGSDLNSSKIPKISDDHEETSFPVSSRGTAKIIGLLPGLGAYSDSSDSDSNASSDIEIGSLKRQQYVVNVQGGQVEITSATRRPAVN